MQAPRNVQDAHVGLALDQPNSFQVHPVHAVQAPGHHAVLARARIVDQEDLGRVDESHVLLPAIGIQLQLGPHAGLEGLQGIGARPDARLPIGLAVLGRHDVEVIIGQNIGEVGVAALQGEDHAVRAVGLDILDAGHDAFGAGLGVLAPVQVQRGDDVLGLERLAVVPLDALAQLEDPGLGVVAGLPSLD